METSWGNGGIIHASEVEPWSQPGMPMKILKWLGREDAPLLLRYAAIPHMFGWGIAFARNCTPERFRANALSNLHLALHSLKSLQEIGAETGIPYDRATRGVLRSIGRRKRSTTPSAPATSWRSTASPMHASRRTAASSSSRRLNETKPTLAGALYFERDEVGDSNKFGQGLAAACAANGVQLRFGEKIDRIETGGGKVTGVVTDRGKIAADTVVVALGSFTAPMLARNGIRVPIYPVKGVSITFKREGWNGAPNVPVIDDSKLFGFVPIGDRMRVSGSAEITGYDATPAMSRAQAIIDNASFHLPRVEAASRPEAGTGLGGPAPGEPGGNTADRRDRNQRSMGQFRPRPPRLDPVLRLRPRGGGSDRGTRSRHSPAAVTRRRDAKARGRHLVSSASPDQLDGRPSHSLAMADLRRARRILCA